ncbi:MULTISPECIES: ABC transporter permease [Agrobacterium]|jgi:phospholipid/cholesterol/gamma-HCH transport system permease protein|uniref:Phospholipid/cholesterol/gamma-HCH transport system permease protein n=2 Tax=Agrobacterium tumefaciens TaxID=358 RepID=A0AAW8LJS0_AGRTU|nr:MULTISPECIES: ABC transporter permease [Agrobacterium]AYM05464.1 phospholipid/cholesterol/gamma-HCH transport system permease protein [Agrobacterium tumefaciens]EHH09084.1 ABC transporter, membrane spanning protein [Agrobacterium tumefaciens CCNWGS0286]MBP2533752.1 phospholipid/cholesterol/gamma-HCH transport system permease protein [Agrobacterium tumefaciens]MBP2565034.1 phospholipid/cholesterol/gamma-HCH transport system permease protein [Agrobacterium tumefaciens]MCW8055758.1 MlaE family
MQEQDTRQQANPAAITEDDSVSGGGLRFVMSGSWRNSNLSGVFPSLEKIEKSRSAGAVEIDLSAVEAIDTTGAWIIQRLRKDLEVNGATVTVTGNDHIEEVIGQLPEKVEMEGEAGPKEGLAERIFAPIGKAVIQNGADFLAGMYILGSAVRGAQMKLGRGRGVSPAAIVNQIDHMGVRAVPIIMLMSFLIGAIIAQQGAFQLRYFGAEVFVVDLVGILQLREIGVLLTAIMIAGRSGSAITAEIGSMKMREEIDALKVIGLNPVGVLVFPRLVALTIALPLLTILANFAALFGAAIVALLYSGITFEVFLSRLHGAVEESTIAAGMIKAPFMALIIGIVAAVEGMKVGGSAESLGQHVTSSVVKSIFVVILVDGLFAIFYAAIDF